MTAIAADTQVFLLPDLGEGLAEAEIIEWRVAVGDTVGIDQIVVEVETAKAAVEVPVPYAGTVVHLYAQAGESVNVGAPLISVGPAFPADDAQDPAADRYREEEQASSGNVLIGYGTGHAVTRRRRRRGRVSTDQPLAAETTPRPTGAVPLVISPLVRRLARDNGIDLIRLAPTGPYRVIVRRDVEQAIDRLRPTDASVGSAAPEPPSAPARPSAAGEERIPLRGLRRAVADKLSRSRTEIPDATTWVDVDATGLLHAKDVLKASERDSPIGLMAVLARICVAGLRHFPELNSSVDTERAEIVRHPAVHLGFAAQTERGLVVPVVRDADSMTTAELAAELARLTELARNGTLPPAALTGGTFTLNNYGVFGVDGSTPIINHPEAAILGVGRIVDKPWAVDGALAVRKVTQLSLSFDHRVCDGGVAGGFLRCVADCVERPVTLLARL
ncbi:dihydrolipoamide acetyltransferase family protein [Streptomyces sp. NPDC021218]|uniref:dihydrolipoamide acetyltransferase family protein n=1 Tax=Streptomyces sp. NPDC021218 TaxID=3365119 RepID=UPI003798CDC8